MMSLISAVVVCSSAALTATVTFSVTPSTPSLKSTFKRPAQLEHDAFVRLRREARTTTR